MSLYHCEPHTQPLNMSAMKSVTSLRNLVLTPERIPGFFIPSRSPFLSPRHQCLSPDRTRLLSDPDEDSPRSPLSPTASMAAPCQVLLKLPRMRRLHRAPAVDSDTDVTTRAAMSLPHVEKVTTPYGFRAVLAASPCTRRRESLFHRNKAVTVTIADSSSDLPDKYFDPQDEADPWVDPPPPPPPPAAAGRPSRTPTFMRPVKALGVHMMKELKRLSPRAMRTPTR